MTVASVIPTDGTGSGLQTLSGASPSSSISTTLVTTFFAT
jgi:hypothetical protein